MVIFLIFKLFITNAVPSFLNIHIGTYFECEIRGATVNSWFLGDEALE